MSEERNLQPGNAQPADGEERVVDEDEDGGDVGRGLGAGGKAGADDEEGDGHAHGAPEHEAAAAETVDDEEGNEGGDEEFGAQATRHQAGELSVEAERVFEDGGGVAYGVLVVCLAREAGREGLLGDQVETTNLLEGLGGEGDESAPAVHLGTFAEELLDGELLAAGDGVDLLDLVDLLGELRVVGRGVTQVAHDFAGGVLLAVLEQPARRLGVGEDTDDEHEAEDCLEGNGKAPLEGSVHGDEPEAVVDPVDALGDEADVEARETYQ